MEEICHKKGKIYYSMGEVAEMFDVNPSLIRFWEQKFDILKPHKNKKGNRMFTPEDVDNLKLIYHLVKEKGMTLSGARKRIKENKEGARKDMEVVDRLLSIKSMLMEIRQELKVGADDNLSVDEAEEEALIEAITDLPPEPAAEGNETTMEQIMDMEAEAARQIEEDKLESEAEWMDEEIERVDEVYDLIDTPGTSPYTEVTMDEVMEMEKEAEKEIEQDKIEAEKAWIDDRIEEVSAADAVHADGTAATSDDYSYLIGGENVHPEYIRQLRSETAEVPASEMPQEQKLFEDSVKSSNLVPAGEESAASETGQEKPCPAVYEQTLF